MITKQSLLHCYQNCACLYKAQAAMAESPCLEKKQLTMLRFIRTSLLLHGFIMFGEYFFEVNGQAAFTVSEENSSPRHITAKKGSSVWLHWNYTYIGDGTHFGGGMVTTYREQAILINSTSQSVGHVLAKRIGQNGALTLESPVPSPFNRRFEVISSNSTLVIHDLQYNDSTYQFSSYVTLDIEYGAGTKTTKNDLKPIVSITVNGIPNFKKQPPITLDVNEGSELQLEVEMDGNPQPSATFRWPHLTGSSPTNVSSVQLYPFLYSSTYSLKNVDASYCGRILETRLRNGIGSSTFRNTNVTVFLNFSMDFGLMAEKIAASKCVEVKWNKAESGACYVKYEVVLRNASGNDIRNETGYNIGEIMMCNLPSSRIITNVQLIVSFKAISKIATANVTEAHFNTISPTKPVTSTGTGLLTCGTLLVLSIQLIGSIIHCLT